MPTLSIDGIDPQFLTIDGAVVAAIPRDLSLRYIVAPPEQFNVPVGQHDLRYDLAGAAASLQARGVEAVDRTGEPPIEVRVNVPAEGLELRRLDRFLVDPRGIQTRTGYTSGPLPHALCPPHTHPYTGLQKAFMIMGTVTMLAWAYEVFVAKDD